MTLRPPRGRLIAWVMLLIAVLLMAAFFRYFDRVPYEHWVGFRGEARRNDLLAVERLLASTGMQVRSDASFRGVPPAGATLLLPTERVSLSGARTRALREWVEAGGHLLVVAWTIKAEGGEDALLDPFGIEQVYNELEDDREWEKVHDHSGHVATVNTFGEPLEVHFDPRYAFKPIDAALTVSDDYGAHVITVAAGRGRITALTDVEFMHNGSIGHNDHAAFAWHLFNAGGRGDEVWIVYGEDMPALPALIWQHGQAIVIAALVLLAAFLWGRLGRFGPLLPVPSLARRRLGEHIVASGWFLWRHGEAERLLDDLRATITTRLRSLPGSAPVPSGSHHQLVHLTRIPAPAVDKAFAAQAGYGEHEFIETVRTLETIRKRL